MARENAKQAKLVPGLRAEIENLKAQVQAERTAKDAQVQAERTAKDAQVQAERTTKEEVERSLRAEMASLQAQMHAERTEMSDLLKAAQSYNSVAGKFIKQKSNVEEVLLLGVPRRVHASGRPILKQATFARSEGAETMTAVEAIDAKGSTAGAHGALQGGSVSGDVDGMLPTDLDPSELPGGTGEMPKARPLSAFAQKPATAKPPTTKAASSGADGAAGGTTG